jgi:hypothetical protein
MNKWSMWIALLLTALSNPLMACESGRFGMVSITAGQTVQVQVVNTNNSTKAACRLIVEFSDHAGNVINDITSHSFTLRPGRAASATIDHPNLRPGERFYVRADVRTFELKAAGWHECDDIHATIEVFDTDTGKTTIVAAIPD